MSKMNWNRVRYEDQAKRYGAEDASGPEAKVWRDHRPIKQPAIAWIEKPGGGYHPLKTWKQVLTNRNNPKMRVKQAYCEDYEKKLTELGGKAT